MPHHAAMTLPPEPRSASLARQFVTQTLNAWEADVFTWDATAIVSELTTNAVLHAGTVFTVAMSLSDDLLRLEVADGSPELPASRGYGLDATTGRGLAVLEALSRGHGAHTTGAGKTVWCELVPAVPGQRNPGIQEVPEIPAQQADLAGLHVTARAGRDGQEGNAHDRLLGPSVARKAAACTASGLAA
jgi:anti-sigma regulatory factor (Ser/Thr protein kinase)